MPNILQRGFHIEQLADSVLQEILHTIVLALTTIGFPATNAALSWAEEVLAAEA